MAGVRDPAFWKRFSTAVHLDQSKSSPAQITDDPKEDGWLARQQAKRKRRLWVCCGFWLVFAILLVIIVILVFWLVKSGTLGSTSGPNPNGGIMGS